jgi:hypothetical protein
MSIVAGEFKGVTKIELVRLVSNTRIESNDRSSEDVDSVLSTLMKMLQQ